MFCVLPDAVCIPDDFVHSSSASLHTRCIYMTTNGSPLSPVACYSGRCYCVIHKKETPRHRNLHEHRTSLGATTHMPADTAHSCSVQRVFVCVMLGLSVCLLLASVVIAMKNESGVAAALVPQNTTDVIWPWPRAHVPTACKSVQQGAEISSFGQLICSIITKD